jgi:Colicin-E5 Imm protein
MVASSGIEKLMTYDIAKLYDTSDVFFEQNRAVSMFLTTEAAKDVCRKALRRGLLITRIEGGIWHNPGFEARVDCIWDGVSPPASHEQADKNNTRALDFVTREAALHDAFVVTAAPMAGWWRDGHKPFPSET